MRLVIKVLVTFVVLLVVLAVGILFVPGEKIAGIAATQFQAQTGRALTFSGKVRFSLFPVLGVTTQGLQLDNADWSQNGPMLTAQSATIGVDALALLGGSVKLRRIEVQGPNVLLEKTADGRVNWQLATDEASATATSGQVDEPIGDGATSAAAPAITLDRLVLSDARVTYVEAGEVVVALTDIDAELNWPAAAGPASLSLGLVPADERVTVEATVTDAQAFMSGAVTAIKAKIATSGGVVTFDGRGNLAANVDGALTVDLGNSAAFADALAIPGLSVPKGFGQAIELSTQLTVTGAQEVHFRDAKIALDHNSLRGDVDVLFQDRPNITARFVAGHLDVTAAKGGGPAAASGADGTGGDWSKAPIDFSALGLLDGAIALTAEGASAGDVQLGALDVQVTLDKARAQIDVNALQVFGGGITGQVIANNRNGFSSRVTLAASGLDMNTLLSQTAGITRFTGQGDAAVNVLMSGASMYDLMNSLDGDLSLSLGAGTITGIDLDALMSGRKGGGTTVFDSVTATGTFARGMLSNDDLVMKLAVIEASGNGVIGVGKRTINYDVVPVAVTSGSDTISLPVKIKGSWDNPEISVDLEKTLNVNVQEELDKAKEKVEEKIKTKVEKELGLNRADGQSLEDAAKEKLEKKVEKGVLKLLGVD